MTFLKILKILIKVVIFINKEFSKQNIINYSALFSIIAFIFSYLIKVPVVFLTYDPKDVVIVLGGLILGIKPVIIIAIVTSFLDMITSASGADIIGFIMNSFSSLAFSIPVVLIYKRDYEIEKPEILLLGLIISSLSQVFIMVIFNFFVIPTYMGISIEDIKSMLFTLIIPFNLIKALVNSAFIFILYKPFKKILKNKI